MKKQQLNELLYEALETELGGVQVYETAIRCAVNENLKEEWEARGPCAIRRGHRKASSLRTGDRSAGSVGGL